MVGPNAPAPLSVASSVIHFPSFIKEVWRYPEAKIENRADEVLTVRGPLGAFATTTADAGVTRTGGVVFWQAASEDSDKIIAILSFSWYLGNGGTIEPGKRLTMGLQRRWSA